MRDDKSPEDSWEWLERLKKSKTRIRIRSYMEPGWYELRVGGRYHTVRAENVRGVFGDDFQTDDDEYLIYRDDYPEFEDPDVRVKTERRVTKLQRQLYGDDMDPNSDYEPESGESQRLKSTSGDLSAYIACAQQGTLELQKKMIESEERMKKRLDSLTSKISGLSPKPSATPSSQKQKK
jgi:hypothetical protein